MAKVTFCQEMYFPLQSTQALSAFLKRAGHEVDVAIGSKEEIAQYLSETQPDLIGFSVLTAYRNHMLETAHAIKEFGIEAPIIAGGYDITFMPQILEMTKSRREYSESAKPLRREGLAIRRWLAPHAIELFIWPH